MMKVFVINLDRDTSKLAFMDTQFKRLRIPYVRISGILGAGLSSVEYRASYSSFRWWCAIGRPVVPAEVGCALSHYGIYRRMMPGEVVCVLEDDVILESEFLIRLKEVETFVDAQKPQVILLSSHERARSGYGIVRSSTGMCTDGYVITQLAAQALLNANMPMQVPCDHWERWVKKGLIELYHALPTVVRQNQKRFGSSTQNSMVRVKDCSYPVKIIHKFKRSFGKALDWVLP